MTPEQFRRDVIRGRGRAALCLMAPDPSPYLPHLIHACLRDQRWTVWVEDSRDSFLVLLAELAGAEEMVEDAVLAALPTGKDEWDARQQWRILGGLGGRGRPRARAAVLAYALGSKDGVPLVASWGAVGLQWLLENRSDLFTGGVDWEIETWLEAAETTSGEMAVDAALTPSIREARIAYYERVVAPASSELRPVMFGEVVPVGGPSEPWPDSLSELEERWKGGNREDKERLARRFGVKAPIEERRRLAERMLPLTKPRLLSLLAPAFDRRTWPLDPALLFERVDDERTGESWRRILNRVEDPRLRTLAWERLERDDPDWDSLDWLRLNLVEADAERLLVLLGRADVSDSDIAHPIAKSLIEVTDRLGAHRFVPHLEWVIENTPCSRCRSGAMKRLSKAGLLPDAYRREATWDSESDVRALADERQDTRLTPLRFRRAVDRGMGRAVLCLKENDPAPFVPELIAACLRSGTWHAIDEDRAPYLAGLAELAQVEEGVVDALLSALPTTLGKKLDVPQRLRLLAEFAKRGHRRAKDALLGRSMQDPAAVAVVASLGASALKWLIAARPDLFVPEHYGEAMPWIVRAEEASGREAVEAILPEPLIEARRAWGERSAAKPPVLWITDVEELIARFADPAGRSVRRREAWRFGKHASESDLQVWAQRMEEEADAQTLTDMAPAFDRQSWPLDVEPLFARVDARDDAVPAWRRTLGNSSDSRVRDFALGRLALDPPKSDAIEYLKRNFLPGDEVAILGALRHADLKDEEACHSLARGVRVLAEIYGPERFVPHLEWGIDHLPCSHCRTKLVELLMNAGALSDYSRREAAYDAERETRALVGA